MFQEVFHNDERRFVGRATALRERPRSRVHGSLCVLARPLLNGHGEVNFMDALTFIAVLGGWFLLQRWLLPRLGVPT